MPQSENPLFSGENLHCIRGERTVFSGLEFSASAGSALILRGPNGSGKSSLLRLMAGLLRPASGTLFRDGQSIEDDPEYHRSSLHYVGHHDAIKTVLTVSENLSFWAGVRGETNSVDTALQRFGLSPFADTTARLLSAGQRRRLNLARIAASPAPLWLLDEPATALDSASTAALVELIGEHRASGGIAIMSTHTDLGIPDSIDIALDQFSQANRH
jgi:heme exporter protein A